jgi:hypothetical protein
MYEIKLSTEKTGVEVWVPWDVLKNSNVIICVYQLVNISYYLLNKLKPFCDKWNLSENTEKTKIMIFDKSGRKLKGYSFMYAQQSI